jgi:hypothetical protein
MESLESVALIMRTQSPPKFDTGHPAWLTLSGRRGSFEVEIVSRVKDADTGQYVYQVKGKEGVLHNGGEWMPQAQLTAR